MATLPTREFSIEFTAGTWTDVTADMVSVATRRGRNRELGAFETGSGTVVLRNETRKYDPEYAAGPYYGRLRPNRRIRIRATYNAITYPVMIGYIDRITQTYDGPNAAITTITFSDLFKILNRVELPASAYAAEVLADTPILWWRLDEPSGSATFADSSGNARTGTPTGTVGAGSSTLIVRDPGAAVAFTEVPSSNVSGPIALSSAAPWALEFWFRMPANPTVIVWLASFDAGAAGQNDLRVSLNNVTRFLDVNLRNTAGTGYSLTLASTVDAGILYHAVITHDTDRFLRMYLNGALVGTAATASTGTFSWTTARVGSDYNQYSPNAVIDEFAVYSGTIPTAARIAVHNTVGRTPWNGDAVNTRAGRILDLAKVAAADRSIDTGSTTLQATSLAGSALAYLQKLETTELGELFVTRDGKVRLLGRREAQQGAYLTSNATLADATPAGVEVGYREGSPIFDVDEATLITRATVSRDGSVALAYSDAGAIAEFQAIDATYEGLLHNSDAYSYDYAQWIVNTHKTPTSRVGTVLVALPGDPVNAYPKILGLELGDRVTLKRRPKVGAAITYDYRVEAVAHDTGTAYWNAQLQLSPFNLGAGGNPVWIWGTTKWGAQVWGI